MKLFNSWRTKMLIHRIEYKDGFGPYCFFDDKNTIDFSHHNSGTGRPAPVKFYNLKNAGEYYFGFKSWHQLTNWFDKDDFCQLINVEKNEPGSFFVTIYECDEEFICQEKAQLSFKMSNAVLIKKYSISEINIDNFFK